MKQKKGRSDMMKETTPVGRAEQALRDEVGDEVESIETTLKWNDARSRDWKIIVTYEMDCIEDFQGMKEKVREIVREHEEGYIIYTRVKRCR